MGKRFQNILDGQIRESIEETNEETGEIEYKFIGEPEPFDVWFNYGDVKIAYLPLELMP